ncbi:MAG TPA: hypothetical protein VFP34_05040 [Microlunatus sp.]|nr:hypothetical protein [Microlunatus sp.]
MGFSRREIAMLLVPRQLKRSGMTGSVPYYGGRMSPAQAYAASHPSQPTTPPGIPTAAGLLGHAPVPSRPATATTPPPPPPVPSAPSAPQQPDPELALQQLYASGVITGAELAELRTRVSR